MNSVEAILFSGKNCGVCTAIKPKLSDLMKGYPEIDFKVVLAEEEPSMAAAHTVFNVPVLLILAEDKEYRRYHGAFSLNQVRQDIERLLLLMSE